MAEDSGDATPPVGTPASDNADGTESRFAEYAAQFRTQHSHLEKKMKEYDRSLEYLHLDQQKLVEAVKSHKENYEALVVEYRRLEISERTSYKEELARAEVVIRDWYAKFPKRKGFFMKLFLGDVRIVLDQKGERIRFKQEYERFKQNMTPLWLVLNTLVLVANYRPLDTLYEIFLLYYYSTLALRENILRQNGSNIQPWWIRHHYFSLACMFFICMWPDGVSYRAFRTQLWIYTLYTGFVQILQTRYQMARLYTLRALGQAHIMDVANSDSTQIRWAPNMTFLLPFLFVGQAFTLFNAVCLLIAFHRGAEWQALVAGVCFLAIACGNIFTIAMTIRRKGLDDKGDAAKKKL